MQKYAISIFVALSMCLASASTYAFDMAEYAGTYAGKNKRGSAIVVTLPKSGKPSYNFRGDNVPVQKVDSSGKALKMVVGNEGIAEVTLTPSGKASLSFRYRYKDNRDAATLKKQ